MTKLVKFLMRVVFALLGTLNVVWAQSAQQQGITNSTQILDTSVLFAIGAREAEQAIRGSFGWPTFQEGFVDRVYFRFDPDGYARFSESPRLDEDVFEVICAESSTSCKAQKPGLEIGLTVEGRVQLIIAGITPEDTFYVSDRKAELPLPPSILDPLDSRLETLLSSGGTLSVKRELETVQQISLSGFSAVATYLRWVAQDQSPRVFPRGWPVPAQTETALAGALTQPDLWNAHNSGPQRGVTTFNIASKGLGAVNSQFGLSSQNRSGSAQFGTLGTSSRDYDLSPEQMAIQSLQDEILQLRSQQENRTVQSTQVQDDFGKSFEQQAQSRNLPIAPGYGSRSLDQTGEFAQWTAVNGTANKISNDGLEYKTELAELKNRTTAIEIALQEMRQNMATELRDLRWALRQNAEIRALAVERPVTPSQIEGGPSLDQLEELLLDRLSERDVVAEPMEKKAAPISMSAENTDRRNILELLEKLATTKEIAEDASIQVLPEPPTEPPAEEFVTLSDYIGEMLKKESALQSK